MNKLYNLYKAIKPIIKDSINPHFKNKYFDINTIIAEIKPITEELGLIILQPLTIVDGRSAINTMIIDAETGETIIQSLALLPDNPDPQKMGSAITYFRRYSLQSLLLLEADDDDAQSYNSKPVLTQPQLQAMLKTIEMGDVGKVKAKMSDYVIPQDYSDKLTQAIQSATKAI